MKRSLRLVVPAVFAAVLWLNLTSVATAQQPKPGGGSFLPPGFNIPSSLFLGFIGQSGVIVDPTHSNALALLMRNDVRTELKITAQQREKIEALQVKSKQDLATRTRAAAMEMVQSIQGQQDNNAPEQIQDKVQQGLDKMQTTLQTYQNDLDKQTEALLTPIQIQRLHELDLQWRGPLAASDPKVADTLALNADQKGKITTALQSYVSTQLETLMSTFSDFQKGAGGQANGNSGGPPDPKQMQKRFTDAMNSETVLKARKTAETKAQEMLTPDQKAHWTALLGRKFTFRVADD